MVRLALTNLYLHLYIKLPCKYGVALKKERYQLFILDLLSQLHLRLVRKKRFCFIHVNISKNNNLCLTNDLKPELSLLGVKGSMKAKQFKVTN